MGSPLADAANYQPAAGGDPFIVRAVISKPRDVIGLGDSDFMTNQVVIEARVSDFTIEPAVNDVITIDGAHYVVRSGPVERDEIGAVYRLQVKPQ